MTRRVDGSTCEKGVTKRALAPCLFIMCIALSEYLVITALSLQRMVLLASAALFAVSILGTFLCLIPRYRKDGFEGISQYVLLFLVLSIIVGEYGASFDSRVMSIVSAWRAAAYALLLFYVLFERKRFARAVGDLWREPGFRLLVLFAAVLILSIVAQIVLGHGSGMLAVVRAVLFYGALVVGLVVLYDSLGGVDTWRLVRAACLIMLVAWSAWMLFELITGVHLPCSLVFSRNDLPSGYIVSSGPFMNPNNFASFLAILLTLSLPSAPKKNVLDIVSIIMAPVVVLLVSATGATIVTIAVCVGYAIWAICQLCTLATVKSRIAILIHAAIVFLCAFVISGFAFQGISAMNGIVKQVFQASSSASSVDVVDDGEGVGAVSTPDDFLVQMNNFQDSQGSLYKRLETYQACLGVALDNPIGVGPGNIAPYLKDREVAIVNPHCWLLEIAASYGWATLALLVALLAYVWIRILVVAVRMRGGTGSALLASIAVAVMVSFASSSSDCNIMLFFPIMLALVFLCRNKCKVASLDKRAKLASTN